VNMYAQQSDVLFQVPVSCCCAGSAGFGTGPSVIGGAVTGGAVTGGAVTGGAVTGAAVIGSAVIGGAVIGAAVIGAAVIGGVGGAEPEPDTRSPEEQPTKAIKAAPPTTTANDVDAFLDPRSELASNGSASACGRHTRFHILISLLSK
jgi:hypothetical protein